MWTLGRNLNTEEIVNPKCHRRRVSTVFECRFLLGKFFGLLAVPAHVLSMTGEMLEGQRLEAHTAVWPCLRALSTEFSLSLFLAQSCNDEKDCLAPSLRRTSGGATTQLIHNHGPPLVFVTL